MSVRDTIRMYGGRARRLGGSFAAVILLATAIPPCAALEPATNSGAVPAAACKTPVATLPGAGFGLLCGKRIPAGVFLGSYLSPAADSIGDCVKRCAADDKCAAFSLDNREPPAIRICTLFGSAESFSAAENWVAGVRISVSATSSPAPNPNLRPNPPPKRIEITIDLPRPSESGEPPVVAHYHHSRSHITGAPGGNEASTFPNTGQVSRQVSSNVINSLSRLNTSIALPRSEILPEPAKAIPDNNAPVGGGAVTLTPDMKALQPVYFATDRTRVQGAPLEDSFAGERDPNMTYGRAIVSIPKSHVIGNVERPKFRLIRLGVEPETDADHFRIKDIAWLDRGALVDQLKGGADSVLLFIHGYNVKFADALFKAAQIAFDANFAGTVLVFSWPSAGNLVKYDEDRESADFAVPHLTQTFRLLTDEIGKKNVYIVAHSMGNQVLVNALLESALSKANLTITELVMAAPDVDKDVFGTKLDQVRAVAKNVTVYASAVDKALLASGEKSFGTRLGYVGKNGPNIFAGIDVIDVTAVGDDMLGLDHGTFSSSRAVLDDLGRLIRSLTHLPPDVRTPTLKFMPDKAHVEYWLYPP
jgi:esterase/lipase superfamily enzyme